MKRATQFTHLARPEVGLGTPVNPAIGRASTLLFDKAEDLYRSDVRGYGRHGTGVHDALADLFTTLEDGAGSVLFPSGLAACTYPLLAFLRPGDHLLVTDSVYGPVRYFAQGYLREIGVEVELYDPRIGADIAGLIRETTRVIWLESPGSLTFEVQDVPAIVEVAKAHNILTMIDNTWSAGLVYHPLALGVDISCHAATKYFGGHSDVMYGAAICAKDSHLERVKQVAKYIGNASSPDDAYQILRGFRTVAVRFERQEDTALQLAKYLVDHPAVQQVLHPAIESHPDHDIWKRDFTGAGCIFSVVLTPQSDEEVLSVINRLNLFGIGYSYGGFESLAIHCDPQLKRSCSDKLGGPLVRFACGLEHVEDLKADIEQSLAPLS